MVAKAASKVPEPGRSTGLDSEIDAKSMQFQRHKLGAETHAVEQKPIRNPQKPEDSGENSRKKVADVRGSFQATGGALA